jgi:hypothetical protein
MSMNRIRLNEGISNNQSFTHQQSVNAQFDQKHKKKSSLYQKQSRTPNFHRLKTDEQLLRGINTLSALCFFDFKVGKASSQNEPAVAEEREKGQADHQRHQFEQESRRV